MVALYAGLAGPSPQVTSVRRLDETLDDSWSPWPCSLDLGRAAARSLSLMS